MAANAYAEGGIGWVAAFDENLNPVASPVGMSAASVELQNCRVIFDGVLHNRADIHARFGDRPISDSDDTRLVALAYVKAGSAAFPELRGIFALVICDTARKRLFCVRDPVGLHPLFYAKAEHGLLVSPCIETLLCQPGVSRELNRKGLVDHLARRWLNNEETYFADVYRVPPCHAMEVDRDGTRVRRYWDPATAGERTDWIADDRAQEQFDNVLTRAVDRCLAFGRPGVNLSGGIDSSTIAMLAADLSKGRGTAAPWALSVVLPGPDVDEAAAQKAVAETLDLPHVQLSFDDAVGAGGVLEATLQLSRSMAAPITSVLRPALARIASEARQRGCRVILTGDGADEWVAVNQHAAADMLRVLDIPGIYRLWRTFLRSYPGAVETPLRSMFWRWGALILLHDAWYSTRGQRAVRTLAPGALELWRRRRTSMAKPIWIAPDPTLAVEVEAHEAQWWERAHSSRKTGPYCLRFARSMLDQPQKLMYHEETFALARSTRVRVAQPFWDADLIQLLMRIRPQVRMRDGYTKSLLRRALIRRMSGLGFERRLKSYTGHVILTSYRARAAKIWATMGGVRTLDRLGVVERRAAHAFMEHALASGTDREWLRVWDLINLENWARAHDAGAR
jgi:asparagine synthase (glutamine-hydrolysing)